MSETCSACKYFHEVGEGPDGRKRWICSANPPIWVGTDPGSYTGWYQPQVAPDDHECRFFKSRVHKGTKEGWW